MNTIILYSSKYGSAADCASYVKSKLSGSVSLVDIEKTKLQEIHLESFDTIVIGGSIYVGAVSKKIRALCSTQADVLQRKRVGIFLCCGFTEQFNEYLSSNFSEDLLESAVVLKCFGGEARLDRMNPVHKLMMKAASKGQAKNLKLLQGNMDAFVKALEH